MGAEARVDFLKARSSNETAQDAYSHASYEAQLDSGSRGYTGSIAEATGFRETHHAPMLRWEAEQVGNHMIEIGKVEKWGSCAMIAVAEAIGVRTFELEVDVTDAPDWRKVNEKITHAVRGKMRQGEQIDDLRIEDSKHESKVVATTTTGDAVTRYAIQTRNEWHYFPTLTEAKAWATKALERDRWTTEYQIIKRTVRESGEPLAVVKRVPVKTTKKVTARVGKPGAKTVGWMAAGVYSC